jgi:anti-sigma regulatory factor (Ser/Thr protein kinase)
MAPEISELDRLKDYVMNFVKDKYLANNVMMSCEEWFVNIMSYSKARSILFDIVLENELIKVTFADDGNPFDPTTYFEEKEFDELDTGGMGIKMIRDLTTELRYERVESKNVVTLVFRQATDQ